MNHTILQTLLLNNPEIPAAVSSFCDSWPEYVQAEQDYNSRNFAAAITGLEKVVKAEEDHDDGYAIYHLAHSYRQTGDIENAKKYYQRMIELHPGTQRAKASQQYLDELNRQQP